MAASRRDQVGFATLGRLMRGREFRFDGRTFPYFVALYNTTWANERAVELPIALDALRRHEGKRILEVGNVLKHYVPSPHDVVDKYEEGDQAHRVDVMDFHPDRPYDLVVSISTFEHIGYDEDVRDPQKVLRAIEHVKAMLAPGGELLISVPLGYNAALDEQIRRGEPAFDETLFLKRTSRLNHWKQVPAAEAEGAKYGEPYRAANALLVGRARG
jgi:SAM-dependent methyltransferase